MSNWAYKFQAVSNVDLARHMPNGVTATTADTVPSVTVTIALSDDSAKENLDDFMATLGWIPSP